MDCTQGKQVAFARNLRTDIKIKSFEEREGTEKWEDISKKLPGQLHHSISLFIITTFSLFSPT